MNLETLLKQNGNMLPDIDMEKMNLAEKNGKRIIIGQVWTDYNYEYGFVTVNKETDHLSDSISLDSFEGIEVLNRIVGGNTHVGEFESNGTGSNVKCVRAYAIPSDIIVFKWDWSKDFDRDCGVYALIEDLEFVRTLDSGAQQIDFIITCAQWEECKNQISEQNIPVYYC